MAREHNATAAHFDMECRAAQTRIGAHFHKPAPVRTMRRPVNRGALAGILAAFIIPALCVAGFLVQVL